MSSKNQLKSFSIKIVHCRAAIPIPDLVSNPLYLAAVATAVISVAIHVSPPFPTSSTPAAQASTMLFYISGNKYTFDKIIEEAWDR